VRAKSNFAWPIKLIWVVQSLVQKYISFVFAEIGVCLRRSAPTQGAYRDRHDTRWGMRWTRMGRETSGIIADGEVVWSWRAHAGAKFAQIAQRLRAGDGGKRWFTEESAI
jgi:hypothetical protein